MKSKLKTVIIDILAPTGKPILLGGWDRAFWEQRTVLFIVMRPSRNALKVM